LGPLLAAVLTAGIAKPPFCSWPRKAELFGGVAAVANAAAWSLWRGGRPLRADHIEEDATLVMSERGFVTWMAMAHETRRCSTPQSSKITRENDGGNNSG
jgi:hypothetical protein